MWNWRYASAEFQLPPTARLQKNQSQSKCGKSQPRRKQELFCPKGSPKKSFFSGNLSQIWVGGVANSQSRSKPPQITLKIAFFDLNFTFGVPKSHKNPGVGLQIWEHFPNKKKTVLIFWGFPKRRSFHKMLKVQDGGAPVKGQNSTRAGSSCKFYDFTLLQFPRRLAR